MSYLDLAFEVRDEFVILLDLFILKKAMTQENLDEMHRLTGKAAAIYGHAFLDAYDDHHLSTVFSIEELISSLTYSSFDLEAETIDLSEETLRHFREVRDELRAITDFEEYHEIEDFQERVIDFEELKETLIHDLENDDYDHYNRMLKEVIHYGEQKTNRDLNDITGLGDDDSENEDYEYHLYEASKDADEELERYYNYYNELSIESDSINKASLIAQIKNMEG